MKKSSLTFFILFLALILAGNAKGADLLLGSWTFTINQAPWEYSRGTLIIELNKEKAPVGKMLFQGGGQVDLSSIIEKDKKYTLNIIIQEYTLSTIVEIKDDVLTGYVQLPDGNLPFNATKVVPEN